LSARLDAAEAARRLADANLGLARLVVAAWREDETEPHAVHQELFARGSLTCCIRAAPVRSRSR